MSLCGITRGKQLRVGVIEFKQTRRGWAVVAVRKSQNILVAHRKHSNSSRRNRFMLQSI